MKLALRVGILLTIATFSVTGCWDKKPVRPRVLQLNWVHDPTFAGHYLWTQSTGNGYVVRPGGSNISPVAELVGGRADLAIVGADIFLKSIAEDIADSKPPRLHCISVDFQRNPVGWVMHPDAAKEAGMTSPLDMSAMELNAWLFDKLKSGEVSLGDKRGTETTAVWIAWSMKHDATNVQVVPVGFDASIVLGKPKMAYPVYLNEEPYKLSEKIGRSVIVFDPAADGITLYGNVVVCRHRDYLKSPDEMRTVADTIVEGWAAARKKPNEALTKVLQVYRDVDREVVAKQIERTIDFVFDDKSKAGVSDLSEGGRWQQTVDALKRAGVLPDAVTLKTFREFIDERE